MTPAEIKQKLKQIAPFIAYEVTLDPTPNFIRDGDGPDPTDDGFEAHDVIVSAMCVHRGVRTTGASILGGHYVRDDDPDEDVSGYLPQMLIEASENLLGQLPGWTEQAMQLRWAIDMLKQETRDRYDNPA